MSHLPAIFAATLGAALVFLVQPIMGRVLLPWFGGTAAVWTVCLLFFQVCLLAGYLYAHWLGGLKKGGLWHAVVLVGSLALLPITPDLDWRPTPGMAPLWPLMGALFASVGVPYIALTATAPLLQARVARGGAPKPYRLYAWSNIGSIVGLLLHPFVFEVRWGALHQTAVWTTAYLVFVPLMLFTLARSRVGPSVLLESGPAPEPLTRALWVTLPATGVVLLIAVTDALSFDLPVHPLLWVGPLLLYLLSYVIGFADDRWTPRWAMVPALVVAVVVLAWVSRAGWRASWAWQMSGYGTGLFLACYALHGEVARLKPAPGRLTSFYLHLSVGGALGGLFTALLAPALFPMHLELHLGLVIAWAACSLGWLRARRRRAPLANARPVQMLAGLVLVFLVGALVDHVHRRHKGDVSLYRSFYGALQVKRYPSSDPAKAVTNLLDGRISHGFQYTAPARRREPTAYFARHTGVGRLLSRTGTSKRVGIVGLGPGTLAAYARKGDTYHFYEINPDVVTVAREDFTFLRDSEASMEVILGDGRQSLALRPPQAYDVLILDAFSGDALPAHLLTAEAMAMYAGHLAPNGHLAINVSNWHLALDRVVRRHAQDQGWRWRRVRAKTSSPFGPFLSDWMLLGPTEESLADLGPPPRADTASLVYWRDDATPLLPLLK